MEWYVKFPCGLKIYENGMGVSNLEEIRRIYTKGCPIHGKECNKQYRVRR